MSSYAFCMGFDVFVLLSVGLSVSSIKDVLFHFSFFFFFFFFLCVCFFFFCCLGLAVLCRLFKVS